MDTQETSNKKELLIVGGGLESFEHKLEIYKSFKYKYMRGHVI